MTREWSGFFKQQLCFAYHHLCHLSQGSWPTDLWNRLFWGKIFSNRIQCVKWSGIEAPSVLNEPDVFKQTENRCNKGIEEKHSADFYWNSIPKRSNMEAESAIRNETNVEFDMWDSHLTLWVFEIKNFRRNSIKRKLLRTHSLVCLYFTLQLPLCKYFSLTFSFWFWRLGSIVVWEPERNV